MTALPAFLWGLFAGGGVLLGAAIAWLARPGRTLIASILALAGGLLVATIAFDLMEESFHAAGLTWSSAGFLGGAATFTVVSILINSARPSRREGTAFRIFAGAAVDAIPEGFIIGFSLIEGNHVAIAAIAAIFLANLAEGLSSATGMKAAGRSARFVFRLCAIVGIGCGLCALLGFLAFDSRPIALLGIFQAIAAGALLAVLADDIIPEAFAHAHVATGLIVAIGFLGGFVLSHGFD